jgi:mRNA interferase MazF
MCPINPKRGDVWKVDFNPTQGDEIFKVRPAIVLSSDAIGKLNLKIVVPITKWKSGFSNDLWHIQLMPSNENGLTKTSAADMLQVRSVDIRRFIEKIGNIREAQMEELLQALAIVLEWS